jgi:hypothetical protein
MRNFFFVLSFLFLFAQNPNPPLVVVNQGAVQNNAPLPDAMATPVPTPLYDEQKVQSGMPSDHPSR